MIHSIDTIEAGQLARMFQQRGQARLIRFDEQTVQQAPMDCLERSNSPVCVLRENK